MCYLLNGYSPEENKVALNVKDPISGGGKLKKYYVHNLHSKMRKYKTLF